MSKLFSNIRNNNPLVHMMVNEVTMTDTVNLLLAAGATAVCAADAEEVEEMVSISNALLLNIGTPSRMLVDAMCKAGKEANRRNIPVVLDPVGAGATAFRDALLRQILQEVRCSVIRGNASEIKALVKGEGSTRGVDAVQTELSDEEMLQLSKQTGAIIIASGVVDRVAWDGQVTNITGGSIWQTRITGAGCMLTGILAAAVGACEEGTLQAMQQACIETLQDYNQAAQQAAADVKGSGSFHFRMMDAVSAGFLEG